MDKGIMSIYLAGPMRGYPSFNFPAFDHAAKLLREMGFRVFSPAEHDREVHGDDFGKDNAEGDEGAEHEFSLRETMAADTEWICMEADAIAFLPGSENSKGALAELALAQALGLTRIALGEAFVRE